MNAGEEVPNFAFQATNNVSGHLQDFQGKWFILYFYSRDSTPGCTTEGQDFRDAYVDFKALDAEIFGISRDSLKSHENFKAKQDFPFELISDVDEKICTLFDVMRMKSMYGKTVRGIERSTFLINPKGILAHAWRKVSVNDHVTEVFNTLQSFQANKYSA